MTVNPVGRKATRETFTATMVAPNGRFTWHLNPSTRPTARSTESYDIYIGTRKGCTRQQVTVERRERIDLSDVPIGPGCWASLEASERIEIDPFP